MGKATLKICSLYSSTDSNTSTWARKVSTAAIS